MDATKKKDTSSSTGEPGGRFGGSFNPFNALKGSKAAGLPGFTRDVSWETRDVHFLLRVGVQSGVEWACSKRIPERARASMWGVE